MKADDIGRHDFGIISDLCSHKDGWKCKKTAWACRDVICPILPNAENVDDFRSRIQKATP